MAHFVPTRLVLAVRDLASSTRYWVDALGCTRDFGDGTDGWSFLSRDGLSVMLGECADERPASEIGNHSWVAYVTVADVDAVHAELAQRGAMVITPPESKPWGMREIAVHTPDGHRLTFGTPMRPSGADVVGVALMERVVVGAPDPQVVALEARLRAAQLGANVAELDALISEDLLFTGADGQVASKADDLAAHRSGAVRFVSHEPEELRVRRVGAFVAVTALRARLEVDVGGTVVRGTYRYTRVWARESDGAWRVSGGHVSAAGA